MSDVLLSQSVRRSHQSILCLNHMTVCLSSAAGVTGKYYSNGEETESSEESRDEEKQQKLWQLSGG